MGIDGGGLKRPRADKVSGWLVFWMMKKSGKKKKKLCLDRRPLDIPQQSTATCTIRLHIDRQAGRQALGYWQNVEESFAGGIKKDRPIKSACGVILF